MKGLETKVREALIEKRADELVKFAAENKEYKQYTIEIIDVLFDSMTKNLAGFSDEVPVDLLKEMKSEVGKQIGQYFDNPDSLRAMMKQAASNHYLSYRRCKSMIETQTDMLQQLGEMGEEVIAQYKQSYAPLMEMLKMNDKIVRKVAKIAEAEGIEKATEKESVHKATREVFPTADSYRNFNTKAMESLRQFYSSSRKALNADGVEGKMLAGVITAMSDLTDKAIEIAEKMNGNYIEKTVKEIYG